MSDGTPIEKGQRYRHASFRGTWKVKSATKKFVTLVPDIPFLKPRRIPAEVFPADLQNSSLAGEWKKV